MNADLLVPPPGEHLELTDERKAVLMPKLQALLADFSQLAALERSDLEPVTTDWLVRSYGHGR
jgi:Asp-tRNA(Asn)/Glu-tRNA(Gln) amidotransferase C subunit